MYKIIWGNKAIIIYVQNNTDDLSKDICCLWDWGVDVVTGGYNNSILMNTIGGESWWWWWWWWWWDSKDDSISG